ncbi:MAG: DUF481 domain-containing protein [Bacteriovoracaceae bacterium]|nr:DUF481 domain-containing protein [Bacteriovoracaceae bacterium]
MTLKIKMLNRVLFVALSATVLCASNAFADLKTQKEQCIAKEKKDLKSKNYSVETLGQKIYSTLENLALQNCADTPDEVKRSFTSVGLGANGAKGNKDFLLLSLEVKNKYLLSEDTTIKSAAKFGLDDTQGEEDTFQKYHAHAKLESVTAGPWAETAEDKKKKNYMAFALISVDRDDSTKQELLVTGLVGGGKDFCTDQYNDKNKCAFTVGFGAEHEQVEGQDDAIKVIVSPRFNVKKQLSDNVYAKLLFKFKTAVYSSADDVDAFDDSEASVALSVEIKDALGEGWNLEFGVEVKHDFQVPEGVEKTDIPFGVKLKKTF